MIRRPPRSTRTDTLFPYPTLFRSEDVFERGVGDQAAVPVGLVADLHWCERRRQRARGHDVFDADADAAAVEVFEVAGVDVGGADGQPDLLVLVDAVEVDHPLERRAQRAGRSEEHTSELQSLMRISYAVFCLKNKITNLLNFN